MSRSHRSPRPGMVQRPGPGWPQPGHPGCRQARWIPGAGGTATRGRVTTTSSRPLVSNLVHDRLSRSPQGVATLRRPRRPEPLPSRLQQPWRRPQLHPPRQLDDLPVQPLDGVTQRRAVVFAKDVGAHLEHVVRADSHEEAVERKALCQQPARQDVAVTGLPVVSGRLPTPWESRRLPLRGPLLIRRRAPPACRGPTPGSADRPGSGSGYGRRSHPARGCLRQRAPG
jgi:hypothetical protein